MVKAVQTVVMSAAQVPTPVVHRELSSLNILIEAGFYAIYRQMVRWLADFLADLLAKLITNTVATEVIPFDWRLSIICPIHEKNVTRRTFPTTTPWASLLLDVKALWGFASGFAQFSYCNCRHTRLCKWSRADHTYRFGPWFSSVGCAMLDDGQLQLRRAWGDRQLLMRCWRHRELPVIVSVLQK